MKKKKIIGKERLTLSSLAFAGLLAHLKMCNQNLLIQMPPIYVIQVSESSDRVKQLNESDKHEGKWNRTGLWKILQRLAKG